MIAPHIFVLASILSITWGIYMAYTIGEYRHTLRAPTRRRGEVVKAFRRMVVSVCLWLFVFSFVFRAATSILGLGDETIAQVVFFALAGTNIVGSIFAVISLKFD